MAQSYWTQYRESNFTDNMIPDSAMVKFLQSGSTSLPEEHVGHLAQNYGISTPDGKVGKLLTLFIELQVDKIIKGCEEINCSKKQGDDPKKIILKKEVEAVLQEINRN